MRGSVDDREALLRDVGVDLRGLETGMTEQFLDDSEIRSPIEEMGGEAVAERMRVNRHWRSCVEDPANVSRLQRIPPLVDEDRIGDSGLRRENRETDANPLVERVDRLIVKGKSSLLRALSEHHD